MKVEKTFKWSPRSQSKYRNVSASIAIAKQKTRKVKSSPSEKNDDGQSFWDCRLWDAQQGAKYACSLRCRELLTGWTLWRLVPCLQVTGEAKTTSGYQRTKWLPCCDDNLFYRDINHERTQTEHTVFLSHKHEGRCVMVYVHTVKPINNTPRRPVVVTEDGVVHLRLKRPEQSRSENGHHCNHYYLPCNDLCKKQNEK